MKKILTTMAFLAICPVALAQTNANNTNNNISNKNNTNDTHTSPIDNKKADVKTFDALEEISNSLGIVDTNAKNIGKNNGNKVISSSTANKPSLNNNRPTDNSNNNSNNKDSHRLYTEEKHIETKHIETKHIETKTLNNTTPNTNTITNATPNSDVVKVDKQVKTIQESEHNLSSSKHEQLGAPKGKDKSDCSVMPHKKNTHVQHKKVVTKTVKKEIKKINNRPVVAEPVISEIDLSKQSNNNIKELKNSDINVHISHNLDDNTLTISFNRKDGATLDVSQLDLLDNADNKPSIQYYQTNSRIEHIFHNRVLVNSLNKEKSGLSYKLPLINSGKCEVTYVSYKLKGEAFPVMQAYILNREGSSVSAMDKTCVMPKVSPINIDYSIDNYVVGMHWNQSSLSTKHRIDFKATVNREGKEILPRSIDSYAINKDFTHLYVFKGSNDMNPSSVGKIFSQYINIADEYYFHLQFLKEDINWYNLNIENSVR